MTTPPAPDAYALLKSCMMRIGMIADSQTFLGLLQELELQIVPITPKKRRETKDGEYRDWYDDYYEFEETRDHVLQADWWKHQKKDQ